MVKRKNGQGPNAISNSRRAIEQSCRSTPDGHRGLAQNDVPLRPARTTEEAGPSTGHTASNAVQIVDNVVLSQPIAFDAPGGSMPTPHLGLAADDASEGSSDDQPGTMESQPTRSSSYMYTVLAEDNGGTKQVTISVDKLWKSAPNNRIILTRNNLNQPVGSSALLLAGYLGKLARDGTKLPIRPATWRTVTATEKNEAMANVQTRFVIEDVDVNWILMSLGKKWKDYKSDIKKKHLKPTMAETMKDDNIPKNVAKSDFERCATYWLSDKGKNAAKIGRESREHQKWGHTSGSKSFARLRGEMEASGEDTGIVSMYAKTHTKKNGELVNEEARAVLEKAREMQAAAAAENSNMSSDEVDSRIMVQLLGRERPGRVRGYGTGVRPEMVFGDQAPLFTGAKRAIHTSSEVEQLRQEIQREREERQRIEEERQRVEEERQRELNRLNAQNARMAAQLEHVMKMFGEKFPDAGPPPQGTPNEVARASSSADGGKFVDSFGKQSISSAQSRCGKPANSN